MIWNVTPSSRATVRAIQEQGFQRLFFRLICGLVFAGFGVSTLAEQLPQLAESQSPPSARESVQVDLTGYWVSLVTEEWRWRMMTPPKGDYSSVPLNVQGVEVAGRWDLARDEANGEQCKPFGAAGLMRLPLRVRISWPDDDTLTLESDAGQQTRLFNFGDTAQPATRRTWQGFSVAEWTRPVPEPGGRGRGRGRGADETAATPTPFRSSLKMVTENLRAGYLRKNGVPYSENAVVTEYYERVSGFGNDYMTVTTIVEDPMYLTAPFVTSSHFKREPDGSKWNPTPCQTDPPLIAPVAGSSVQDGEVPGR